MEYAVILPTIWSYLQSLGMNHRWFLGFTISAISIASMVSSPIFGLFADAGGTKWLILAASIFMIVGNFVYLIANDAYCVLESRFICGLGTGVAAATFAYLARISTREESTGVIGAVIMSRQLGMLVGPGFNFAFKNVSVQLGPLLVDNLSAPGAIMTVLWAVCLAIGMVWFKDIERLPQAEREAGGDGGGGGQATDDEVADEVADAEVTATGASVNGNGASINGSSHEAKEGDDRRSRWQQQQQQQKKKKNNNNNNKPRQKKQSPVSDMSRAQEYTQLHVVVLFLVQFLCIFNQVGLETWVTPFTQEYFGWHETNNSIMYITVAGVAITSFLIVRVLTHHGLTDRWVMAVGIGLELTG